MKRLIDRLLNRVTMYRLLVYGLVLLIAISVAYSLFGVSSLSATGIGVSTLILVATCFATNKLMGIVFDAPTNNESWLITALILVCILPPATDTKHLLAYAVAGVVAMTSKFVLSIRHKHVFNPAALAGVVVSLAGLSSVTWWIGNPNMLPFVAVFGLIIARKIRRFTLVLVFLTMSFVTLLLVGWASGNTSELLKTTYLSGPIVFFAGVMLTEPATMPSRRYYQVLYGLLVGALFSAHMSFGELSTAPHLVLVLGNIFAFAVSPIYKLKMRLKSVVQMSEHVYDFVLTPTKRLSFVPGQYMDWTLPGVRFDNRGNRRTFTIASSPTEEDVHLGVKFYSPSSKFKEKLLTLKPGDNIVASQLAGDFVMPGDRDEKLVFLAGGIGITPFRSFIKYLIDTGTSRDAVLFYIVPDPSEVVYKDILKDASQAGVRIVLVSRSAGGINGFSAEFDQALLAQKVPDYKDRKFYISGANSMVDAVKSRLRAAGVSNSRIVTDHFSGY